MKSVAKMSLATSSILVLCMLLAGYAFGFKPDKETHGHRFITKSVLSEETGYRKGEGLVVPKFTTTLSDGTTVAFSLDAARHVVTANESVDLGTNIEVNGTTIHLTAEPTSDEAHCDNEQVENCAQRIKDKRAKAISRLSKYTSVSNPSARSNEELGWARAEVGMALHTLQDFYAHGNFANINKGSQTYAELTENGSMPRNFGNNPACEARTPILGGVFSYATNGGNFRLIGDALTDSTRYTTGYFGLVGSLAGHGSASDTAGSSKCDHGDGGSIVGTIGLSGLAVQSGISKDYEFALDDKAVSEKGPEGLESHNRASYQAALHTKLFLESIIKQIKEDKSLNAVKQDDMITSLLGVSLPMVGFIIDTTGSMSDQIDGVKTNIAAQIDRVVGTGSDAATAKKFMVLDYGDPFIGTPFIGTAEEVKNRVATLFASGGGDCPELTGPAVARAVGAVPSGSTLFVFTDASSKDYGDKAQTIDQIKKQGVDKKIVVNYAVSGSCSPIDPSYFEIATATGGTVLEIEHTSAAVAAVFTAISIDPARASSAQPALIEAGTISAAKVISIPVESGAVRLSVLVNSSSGTIAFASPAGAVVPGADTVVSDSINGRGLKVINPTPGIWSVTIAPTGSATYSVNATVASAVDLFDSRFSSSTFEIGRRGHQGDLPFGSTPPLGKSRLHVSLAGSDGSPTFAAIAADGSVISNLSLSRITDSVFEGEIDVGSAPFRIRATGKTIADSSFTRVTSSLYSAIPFSLEPVFVSAWGRGATGELQFRIRNYSSDDTFSITAAAPGFGAIQPVNPVSIKQGESAVVSVKLTVDALAPLDVAQLLRASVTNSASFMQDFTARVLISADTDLDGVQDTFEQGPNGTDPTYDGNGDGIPDSQQNNVVSFFSARAGAYITMSVPVPAHFVGVTSALPAPGNPFDLPLDTFIFRIEGVAGGASVSMTMHLPKWMTATSYAKFGPESSNAAEHWYDFKSDGTTGATISGNIVTLRFVDGQRGDDDLAANGVIMDAGGPSGVVTAGIAPPQEITTTVGGGGGGGGGGCTIGNPGRPDHSLLILGVIAGLMLAWRANSRWRRNKRA